MKTRALALLLSVLMVFQYLPVSVMAADTEQTLVSNTVGGQDEYHTVTFYADEEKNTVWVVQFVKDGETPIVPDDPGKDKCVFEGWSPNVADPVTGDTEYTPVFKEVGAYTVTIQYVLDKDGEITTEGAPDAVIRTYLDGETFTETYKTPKLNGWVPDKDEVVISSDDLTEGENVYVVTYVPADKFYTVEHWFEALDSDEFVIDDTYTESVGALVGMRVEAEVLNPIPDGFVHNKTDDPVQLEEGDEPVVLRVYYKRAVNTVEFDSCGGEAVNSVIGKYEMEYEVPGAKRLGYTFAGWHTSKECEYSNTLICTVEGCEHKADTCWELTGTCVCGEAVAEGDKKQITATPYITYYAAWAANEVEYTVVYYIEKQNLGHDPQADALDINDFMPSPITFKRKAIVGSKVTATDEDKNYQGLTAYTVHGDENAYAKDVRIASYLTTDTVVVEADGSTTLNVYFKRDHFTYVMDGYNSFKRYGDHGDWRDDQLTGEADGESIEEQPVHLYFKYHNTPGGISGTAEGDYWSVIIINNIHYGETITDRWPDVLVGDFYVKDDEGNFVKLDDANLSVSVGATNGSLSFDGWRGVLNGPDPQENVINTSGYRGVKVTGRMLCNFNREGEELANRWRGCLMVKVRMAKMMSFVEKVIIPTDAPRNTTGAPIEINISEYEQYTTISSANQSQLFIDWDHTKLVLEPQGSFDPNENYWQHTGNSGVKSLPHTYGWWVGKITGFEYDWVKTRDTYDAYGASSGNPYNAHYVTDCLCSRDNCGYARSYDDGKGLVTDDGKIRLMPFMYNRIDYKLNFIPKMGDSVMGDSALATSYMVPYEADLSWWEPIMTDDQKVVKIDGVTYTFGGWYYDEAYENPVDWENDRMPAEGFSVYGQWIPATIEITFDWNYEGAPEYDYVIVPNSTMKDQVDFIAVPTRENYRFIGWYETEEPADNEFDDQQKIGEEWDKRTLYAAWERISTGYTVQYLLKGSNVAVAPMKTVKDLDCGIQITENHLERHGLWPETLSQEITLKENIADNHIIFYYTTGATNQYQVFHHYTKDGVEKVIAEDPVVTSDGRVVEYSGHEDIPAQYLATEAAKSLVLVSDYTKNEIHFYYLPYPTASYVVHHYYQTDVDTQTDYTMYPEDTSVLAESDPLRKGYTYIAQRELREGYEITNIFVEETPASITKNVYLTPTDAQMGTVTHVHMYYKLIPLTTATVQKVWDDADNQDGKRPANITVELLADGVATGMTVELSEANNWTATLDGLKKYNGSTPINYTWREGTIDGYTLTSNSVSGTLTTLVNTHVPEKISIAGTKTWEDNNNQDGIRPARITIHLLANGDEVATKTVTMGEGWAWTFTDLDKYAAGKEIEYTIIEDVVEGYEATIKGSDVTNTHTPITVDISGSKTWDDNNNQDGKRPASITIGLLANGSKVVATKTVTEADGWTWTFTDLPKYEAGVEIEYTITENVVAEYTTTINGYNVTNTHKPEKVEVSGTKTWEDNNNQDGKRPESIIINLLANGNVVATKTVTEADGWAWSFTDLDKYENGVAITYTITEEAVAEYTTEVDGYNVTNTHAPITVDISGSKTWEDNNNQDGKRPESITINLYADGVKVASKTVTEADGWAWSFTDLDKYAAGKEIVYTITEDEVAEYTTTINGYDVTNTHAPEKVEVSGSKTWDDAEDQDGKRPESITINLLANGKVIDTVTVTEADGWAWTFADLDKYAEGKEIVYTITEDVVEEYTTTINGYDVTNTHAPEKVEVSGSKTWDDAEDQDGKRPESIIINLFADNVKVASKTVTAKDNWAWSFADLDKYAEGKEIVYTITEDAIAEYTTTINGYDVTNTHEPEKVEVSGSKTWIDNNDQDGKRPESITINLLANGKVVATKTVTEADGWAWSFTDLDKFEDGVAITYTITEDVVEGYTTVINGYNVTNSYTPEKTGVSGSKIWNDADNQDGIRPESITINLLANGKVIDTKTVTEADGWAWSFIDLDKYEAGEEITYTITEDVVEGYTTVINGYNVTNTHEPAKVDVSGSKTWNDANNQDGKRPTSITIHLLANGEVVATKTVTAEDKWAWSFTDLDKYEAGEEIEYTITEEAVAEYTTEVDGYDVTNTHALEKVEVSGSKTWDDADNQDGKRPTSITINLLANGEVVATKNVTEADGWAWSFTNLDKYENGVEIEYTITEEAVEEYTTEVDGYNVTNTHAPEKVEVSGSKTWDDADNQDGIRPESITINLLANGEVVATKTVTEADGWAWSFTDLDKYAAGNEIEYTITENEVEGYTTVINGYDVTNTHEPEKVEVSGSKTWDDADNQDGKRPTSITINLLANGEVVATKEVVGDEWAWSFTNLDKYENGVEIEYTITEEAVAEYTTTINGYNVTNTHKPEKVEVSGVKTWNDANNQDGKRPESITINLLANGEVVDTVTVTEADGWAWSFTDLDKFAAGNEIVYTITENEVEGYTTVINDYDVTNTHEPEKVEVSGSKTWDDADNQDGKRPESIIINLLANGEVIDTVTVTAENKWAWSFTDLDKYEAGEEIEYTITEEAVAEYTTTINGYDVTNTHEPEKVEVSGSKTWDDADNQDGKRPESITINLLANGEVIDTVTVTAEDKWAWSFTDLDKYAAGEEIIYTITEDAVEDYVTTINGYNVINSYDPEKTNVSGSKRWDDANNQDGKRPERITINLLANGEVVATKTVTAEDKWAWNFTDLDKFAAGEEIEYTITEEAVEGYTTVINGYNVTNSYTPEKTSVSGSKTWDDADNQDGKRPESIIINLLANGEVVASKTVTEADGWAWSFTDLDKYENGVEIEYTITEEAVAEYTSEVDGYDVTNTHAPEKVEVSGSKTWNDAEDQDGKRPESITINLLANGKVIDTVTVTEADGWAWTFADLDKYEDGVAITYTITEDVVAEYTTTINGYDVTNTHEPEKVEVSGSKTWEDAEDQDGKRPESIIINLFADDAKVASKTVTAEDNWAWTFADLDKYAEGNEIVYTITEDVVAEYTTTINGYDVTNTHEPEKVEVTGSKTWDDADNQDGKRPESIIINLLANGEVVASKTVTEADGWAWSFTDLDKYENGVEIEYTITEEAVAEYTSEVDGYDVTNTHAPEKVEVSGSKTWDDADNQDGIRPESITINLLANGEVVATKTVTEADGWAWSFTNLDKYENGVEIEYTITEDAVAEYTTTIDGYNVTNTHAPEKVEVTGSKTWDDADNQDGKRPTSITINLLANGEVVDTVTVTEADGWAWSFTDLDKYEAGEEIVYTITEEAVAEYTTTINGYDVTNTHAPEKVEVSGSKTWDDADNQDGKRPESITINLLANGEVVATKTVTEADGWAWTFADLDKYAEGKEIEYTITEEAVAEYTTEVDGYDVTNTHAPEKVEVTGSKTWEDADNQDGIRPESITINLLANGEVVDTVTVTEADGWAWSFTDLDKYAAGEEIEYTITEEAVEGYTSEVDGYNVTNTHEPEKVEVSGSKTWDDADNQDGKRPTSITINLLANGEVVDTKEVVGDEWAWSFTNLDKYAAGEEIVYTITEEAVAEYTTTINGYDVTNTHAPEKVEVSGSKTWNDADNQDGKRPESITINLLANGEVVATKTVTEDDGWAWSFTDLDKYAEGKEIEYTITEDAVAEYTITIDGYNVTNTHAPEKVEVNGSKTWMDNNNQDGKRPTSITINLFANGEKVASKTVTARENWKWSFKNLDKYANGEEIEYTITEDALNVSGYTAEVKGYNVINWYTTEKRDILVNKIWDDNNDQDGIRPESVVIRLYANGEYTGKSVVLSEANRWRATFKNLDVYEAGAEIHYTVVEESVAGYTATVHVSVEMGLIVKNTHTPEKVNVSGRKIWDDNENRYGIRPDSITINLYADGVKVASKTVTEVDGWAWNFTNLNKYENGREIGYQITENAVNGYATTYYGYNVVNTAIEVAKIDIPVSKIWNDGDNASGVRPESIVVELYANGVSTGKTLTLSEANGWFGNFTELAEYDEDGKLIVYTINEHAVEFYTTAISGNANTGFAIVNTTTVVEEEEYEDIPDDPVPLAPQTGDGFGMIAVTALLSAAAFVLASKKKKATGEDSAE